MIQPETVNKVIDSRRDFLIADEHVPRKPGVVPGALNSDEAAVRQLVLARRRYQDALDEAEQELMG